jgi:putative PIN family toxin of toxin-antitoxin system
MANPTITIPLDPQTARAYDSAGPDQKRKIQALLGLWLRELTVGENRPLEQILDEVGRKARAGGLTSELLDSLLRGE